MPPGPGDGQVVHARHPVERNGRGEVGLTEILGECRSSASAPVCAVVPWRTIRHPLSQRLGQQVTGYQDGADTTNGTGGVFAWPPAQAHDPVLLSRGAMDIGWVPLDLPSERGAFFSRAAFGQIRLAVGHQHRLDARRLVDRAAR